MDTDQTQEITSGNKNKIILCSFYSPPGSKKQSKLKDHIIGTLHMLTSKYEDLGIIIGGDKNKMNISEILMSDSSLQQIVTKPTNSCGQTLDIIITNLKQYYNCPQHLSPVAPDDPTKGKPSDHDVLLGVPHTDPSVPLSQLQDCYLAPTT